MSSLSAVANAKPAQLIIESGQAQERPRDEQQGKDQGSDAALAIEEVGDAPRPEPITEADSLYNFEINLASAAPTIDGVIDEVVWNQAVVLDSFTQATPNEGEPITERTEVRVLYDAAAIYIAAICYDSDPGQIVANVLKRDQPHTNNDSFLVTLDTYHDHRNGFYFETNPMGAKFDAQIVGEGGTSLIGRLRGEGFNADWDAVWDVAARINDDGWTVEIEIPFWSVRFEPDHTDAWGVNFRRSIRRRSEESYWAPIPRQYSATRLSQSGMMTGLRVGRSRNLQFKPYVRGDVGQVPTDALGFDGQLDHTNDWGGDIGLDMKWGVTPNLTIDGTINPDFAQVEADFQQVNLTRFTLFFPEKREFFLENAGFFEFGTGAGINRGGVAGSVVGFHSRRIGISEDQEEVPLYGGGRLTGKINAWSLGMLTMQSQSTEDLPSENYSVLRVRRDLGSRSGVGMLVTNRQSSSDVYNRELGVDGRWAIDPRTTVDAWWMKTETPGLEGEDWAGQVKFDWGTPTWQFDGWAMQVGENFSPEMGFVNRVGLRNYSGTLHWTPYPETEWIRNHSPHANFFYTTDTDNRLLSRFLHLDWDTYLKRGDKLSVAHNRRFEQLDFAFEISPGVFIEPGAYDFSDVNIEFQSDASRTLNGSFNYTWGDFWSGTRQEYRVTGGGRVGARFSASVSWNRNDVELPEGAFITDLVITRLNLDFSTRLSLAGLIQYNSQTDQVLSNIRLNFIHTPGSDLYIVYNERRLAEDSDLIDRALIVKLTYLLRF